ncbi:MAG: twin-arginine translocase subunit TatC [Endomicrobiales bacterium]|nr:twin-arginine translocase subunit TatC [Endomicrobiales bacterium]
MKEQNHNEYKKSLTEHFEELRRRLLICLGYLAFGTIIGFLFSSYILNLLKIPIQNLATTLIVTKPTEAIVVYFKISLYAGIILSIPVIFYQFWQFVKPAMPKNVSVSIINWILVSFLLFLTGTVFSYTILVPAGFKFLFLISKKIAYPMFTLNAYISFLLAIMILGGIIFELPVLSALLTKIGIVTPQLMRKKRKEAIMVSVIFAAVFTPTTDVFNLALFVMPIILLYEISIIVSKVVYRTINSKLTGEVYVNG